MPVPVPPVKQVQEKFRKRVEVAGPDYEFGVKNPLRDWEAEYVDAVDRIHEGLREAIEQGRLAGGVKRRGVAFWKGRASRKGPPRWRDETPKSADTFATEISDFLSTIAATALEKKKRKGDPANIEGRVKPIVQALRNKKLEKRGFKPMG
jgi:hypothetical protein